MNEPDMTDGSVMDKCIHAHTPDDFTSHVKCMSTPVDRTVLCSSLRLRIGGTLKKCLPFMDMQDNGKKSAVLLSGAPSISQPDGCVTCSTGHATPSAADGGTSCRQVHQNLINA